MNKPRLISLWMLLPVTALFILIGGESIIALWIFALLFATLDAAFPVTWAISGDFFGRKHFATIRGNMTFFYMWGSFAGPVLAGAIYDRTQSYARMMGLLFVLLLIATGLNTLLINPWRKRVLSLK